ncbi:TetR/AcrR family transcriptional regulator C-terminal ligand-binding domain-containing protein [Mycobacterium sp.]|uniref:TetR/AcrR family transcriptional regulator C-terminal ligand-binding domain-containing protein n=1 Tax=Mycobacterium sp. TaxID=1785 RepID=UPI0031E03F6A
MAASRPMGYRARRGRGELPANTDTDVLLTTFPAPPCYRMVTTGDPVDDGLIAQSTRVTLAAARAGSLSG